MKHTSLVLLFAATLAAQTAKDPKVELAPAIAVEEQEGDLAKAETIYRDLLAGTKLSAAARAEANLRLGHLLQKLGRAAEAKGFLEAGKPAQVQLDDVTPKTQEQDVEREKVLRGKARELVQQIAATRTVANAGSPLTRIDTSIGTQLLWIGLPAVPEVIAALESIEKADSYHPDTIKSLAQFLWYEGGPQAADFLRAAAGSKRLVGAVAQTAGVLHDPAMLEVAATYLRHPDWQVTRELLYAVSGKFEPPVLLDAAEQGGIEWKIYVLREFLAKASLDTEVLARLHRIARAGLASADPQFGTAAQQFLLSATSQGSLEGVELLLAELPKMPGDPKPQDREVGSSSPFDADQARRLLPQLDACAHVLASEDCDASRGWMEAMMWCVATPLDESVVPTVLGWIDLGYQSWFLLDGRVTSENAKQVFARFDRIAPHLRKQFVDLFAGPLPPDLFPLMRAKAQQMSQDPEGLEPRAGGTTMAQTENTKAADLRLAFFLPMARTGNPEAADWLLGEWHRLTKKGRVGGDQLASALVELGRHTQVESVRAAMRTACLADSLTQGSRTILLLALLSMHDECSLDLVAQFYPATPQRNPYAIRGAETAAVNPLQYLVYANPDPPHGFSEDQVIGVLRKIPSSRLETKSFACAAVPDRLLGEFLQLATGTSWWSIWADVVLARMRENEKGHESLQDAVRQQFQSADMVVRAKMIEKLLPAEVADYRASIEACLDIQEEHVALQAAYVLADATPPITFERLLSNKHAKVRAFGIERIVFRLGATGEPLILPMLTDGDERVRRQAAESLGAIVSTAAVPGLIGLLRDPDENVRTKAAAALTKIRFYHEQQAHWDRVLKGLDASSASAAEKLLLQAKPGAPKPQRLLAIESLGTLGVPEALPFLIDWTTDPDAEIATKAKAAITAIHLTPRK